MEEDLTSMDQEGMLREFRAKAVLVDAEEVGFFFKRMFFVPRTWSHG